MTVGATMQRTPSASTAAARAASATSTTSVPDPRRVQPGHADHGGLGAELGHEPVGRPLERGAGHDGRDGHDPVAARDARASRTPGDGQDRADRDDGVRRADHDGVRTAERLHDAGRGPGRGGALEAHAADRHVVAEPDEVVLEADLGPRRAERARLGQGDPGAQRIVGHRQQPHRDAAPAATVRP